MSVAEKSDTGMPHLWDNHFDAAIDHLKAGLERHRQSDGTMCNCGACNCMHAAMRELKETGTPEVRRAIVPREPSPELAEAEAFARSQSKSGYRNDRLICAELDRLRAEVARLSQPAPAQDRAPRNDFVEWRGWVVLTPRLPPEMFDHEDAADRCVIGWHKIDRDAKKIHASVTITAERVEKESEGK